MRRAFFGGNWKCNGNVGFLAQHLKENINTLRFDANKCQVVIAPVALHLNLANTLLNRESGVELSAQNLSFYEEGAFTGEISASQLADFNVAHVIVGHSERRAYWGETNDVVGKKVNNAHKFGINAIACFGEKLQERESGKTMEVIRDQLKPILANSLNWDKLVLAYEPVWAIGTGKTASPEQAQEVHAEIRHFLGEQANREVAAKVRIIYGGSVTEKTCDELIQKKDIDGFLIGGAALKPAFGRIVESYKLNI